MSLRAMTFPNNVWTPEQFDDLLGKCLAEENEIRKQAQMPPLDGPDTMAIRRAVARSVNGNALPAGSA